MQPSKRSGINPFLAMDVLRAANARAASGHEVLHLELGEPGGGAPAAALQAAHAAMTSGPVGYTDALGLAPLRQAIAGLYADWHDITIPAERIAVTAGASGGFVLSFLAAFDPGDRVAVADPGYPCYRNTLAALGIETVRIATDIEHGFQPTVAMLEAVEGPLHGIVIASPANPTGSMIAETELRAVAEWCRRRRVRIIADEIYHGITYDQPASTVLHHELDAVVVNSFSKFFCMTGWRIGWLVLPDELVAPVERLAQNLFISPSGVGQHAALGALGAQKELRQRIESYRANRTLLLNALSQAGIENIAPADGAFYIYADIGHLTDDSVAFCERLLEETGIALTPGLDFDPVRGGRYVRFSFAGESAVVEKASQRLVEWVKRQR